MVTIRFTPHHPLAKPLQQSFAALFCGDGTPGALGVGRFTTIGIPCRSP
jgi:hypothetical protein